MAFPIHHTSTCRHYMFKKFIAYCWQQRTKKLALQIASAFTVLLLAKLLLLTAPLLLAHIIGTLQSTNAQYSWALFLIIAYGISHFSAMVLDQLRQYLFVPAFLDLKRTLVVATVSHLYHLPYEYHTNQSSGSLSNSVSKGIRGFDIYSYLVFFIIIPVVLELVCTALVIAYMLPWYYAAGFVALFVLYIGLVIRLNKQTVSSYERIDKAENELAGIMQEGLSTIESIKYTNAESIEIARIQTTLLNYQNHVLTAQKNLNLLHIAQAALLNSAFILFFATILTNLSYNTIPVFTAITLFTYWLQFTQPIEQLAICYNQLLVVSQDVKGLFSLLDLPTEPQRFVPATSPVLYGTISCNAVSYQYRNEQFALRSITFSIENGKTLALVGPNGSGKTTLIRLLMGIIKPTQGTITLDGIDTNVLDPQVLNATISIVPQDIMLFNNTIAYNMCYGTGAKEAELQTIIEQLAFAPFIATLPNGLQTIVGQRGTKLSGGQRQKIAIARALLKKPTLLIMDEATSALDARTEQEIQQLLRTIPCTKIIIAHRLAAIKDADTIAVLHNGTVQEIGSHDALFANKQLYYQLWNAQQHHGEL